jgi:hypothetical protein
MSKLEDAIWGLESFVKDEADKTVFQAMVKRIQDANADNLEAQLPVGHLDEQEVDLDSLGSYAGCYIIITGTRHYEGDVFDTEGQYQEYCQKKAEERYELRERYVLFCPEDQDNDERIIDNDIPTAGMAERMRYSYETTFDRDVRCRRTFVLYDLEEEEIVDGYGDDGFMETRRDADYARDETIEDMVDEFPDWKRLEFEEDEVMWDTVYRYNNEDPDVDLAQELGLGVLEVTDSDSKNCGDRYLFLRGCGMDLSPLFGAYEMIHFGCISSSNAYTLYRDTKYFKSVVGSTMLRRMLNAAGLSNFIPKLVEAA